MVTVEGQAATVPTPIVDTICPKCGQKNSFLPVLDGLRFQCQYSRIIKAGVAGTDVLKAVPAVTKQCGRVI